VTGLEQRVAALPPQAQLAFAAVCGERLLPLYRSFSIEEQWGDTGPLRETLDEVWRFVGGMGDGDKLGRAIASCEAQAPDTDDFSSGTASLALNAVGAVSAAGRACLASDPFRCALQAKEMADETAFAVSQQSVIDPDAGTFISDRAEFLAALDPGPPSTELAFQRTILDRLEGLGAIDSVTVSQLQEAAVASSPYT
jgi:uncharacterized protein YjaG (DUF416 family)